MKLSEVPVNGVYRVGPGSPLVLVLGYLSIDGRQRRFVWEDKAPGTTIINTDINNPEVVYLGQGHIEFRVLLDYKDRE